MESHYQGTSPAEIEVAARKYAQARGYDLEIINIPGDDSAKQEATARARIEKGGIDAVYGFSAGGYTADRLQKQFPKLAVHQSRCARNVRRRRDSWSAAHGPAGCVGRQVSALPRGRQEQLQPRPG
jgi:hypothetical protein